MTFSFHNNKNYAKHGQAEFTVGASSAVVFVPTLVQHGINSCPNKS